MAVSGAKAFVVDDDGAVREAVRELLESVGLDVQTFASAREFLEGYDPQCRACLLLDVRMPDMSGLQLQDELLRRGSHMPIIFVTGHGDIAMAVDTLQKGAVDFVEKPFGGQALIDKVNKALDWDEQNLQRQAEMEDLRARLALLTPKEKQVLQSLMEGKRAKQIAMALGLSRKTVDWHLSNICDKIEVDSTGELRVVAYKVGCLDSEGSLRPGIRPV